MAGEFVVAKGRCEIGVVTGNGCGYKVVAKESKV
jgi:hypothetical protein